MMKRSCLFCISFNFFSVSYKRNDKDGMICLCVFVPVYIHACMYILLAYNIMYNTYPYEKCQTPTALTISRDNL